MLIVEESMMSLTELLTSLTKDELHNIRRTLNIQQASQLNKADLVQRLYSYMMEHLNQHLEKLDHNRYNVLDKVSKAPGCKVPLSEMVKDENYDPAYFQAYGLLLIKNDTVHLSEEIGEGMRRYDPKRLKMILDRNTDWVKLTQGLLYYYGCMGGQELKEKIEHYTGQSIDGNEYEHMISELEQYDGSVSHGPHGFSHYTVDDPKRILGEQSNRPELDYYPFTKAQVLSASADGFVDRHAGYVSFVSFIKKHWTMEAEEADLMTAELVDRIQRGESPSELVSALQDELDFKDMQLVQQLLDGLMVLMNNTRLWELKGYTPQELSRNGRKQSIPQAPSPLTQAGSRQVGTGTEGTVYSFQTKKKVGRNDPCPCGSGKKYKKCCLG
ncbi:YecA family protein [Paenibacillus silviterrae]|uniref:YecA family protein n=1 Tax=Paenibacillus silviterrae TaxID=3242194 RepID=UPI002543C3E6|nr:SEC-C metal-binding domain-containing protein [Paenibacillus chinjuensis]